MTPHIKCILHGELAMGYDSVLFILERGGIFSLKGNQCYLITVSEKFSCVTLCYVQSNHQLFIAIKELSV